MGNIIVRKKNKSELLAAYRKEKAQYDAIKVAIAEIRDGAASASVSTAGGSQSYTKSSLSDLTALLATAAKRCNSLLAKIAGTPDPSKPRRAKVTWGDC